MRLVLVHMIGGVCGAVMRIGLAILLGLVLRLVQFVHIGAERIAGGLIIFAHAVQPPNGRRVPVRVAAL